MATYYIDTNADPGGDGTTTALTGANCAFNTWPSSSLTAGQTYLQKAGTTDTRTVAITLGGDNITLGAYGTGERPHINLTATNVHAINALNRTGTIISGLKITSAATVTYVCINIYATTAASNPQIMDCELVGGTKGIQIAGTGSTHTADGALIKGNIVHGSANDGIYFKSTAGSARILNNITYDTGDDGIAVECGGTANEISKNTCTTTAGTKQPIIISDIATAPTANAYAWIHDNVCTGGIYCLNVSIGALVECNTLIGLGTDNTEHMHLEPLHASHTIRAQGNICNGTVVTDGSIVCSGTTAQGTFILYNNTVDGSTPRGIWILTNITTATITARNNRLIGRDDAGSIGIAADSADWIQLTESNSAITGFATSIGTGGVLDATSNITGAYVKLGTWIAGVKAYDGIPLPPYPDIGAVQDRAVAGRRSGFK